jgi:predicted patatin/cPLA2 family phospholipase
MKLGLILEGGASRTYFSCGVLDALLDEDIIADYVIGTSAGIANALSYVSGQKGRNLLIAKEFLQDKRYMGIRHLLNPFNRSYYHLDFVFEKIPNQYVLFDYEAFAQFKGDVVATVTNVETAEAEYLPIAKDDHQMLAVRASCALPMFFPIIKVNGQPYMDGGIVAPIPVDEAIRSGCDKNIVILTRERGYKKRPEKLMSAAARIYQKHALFAQALLNRDKIYNDNLVRLKGLEVQGRVFIIAPDSIGGIKRTESDPEIIEALYNQGLKHFKAILPELKKYLEQ